MPNYHKKAEKSLNDSLLAIYEQKHGTIVSTSGENGSVLNGNIMSSNNIKKIIWSFEAHHHFWYFKRLVLLSIDPWGIIIIYQIIQL